MTTLFDYLSWRGDLPLSADPFHEVDGVILARFTYMPFHRVLRRDSLTPTTVEAVCRALLALPDIETAVRRRGDTDLLRALVESPRYKGMELTAYADRLDAESQTQFSAITVKLEEDHYCVAYRGTDNTLIGWKEDFNMGFVCPVPGQKLAVDYLQKAARRLPGRLTVCGHSKGGNFAVYAAAFCGDEIQDRIEAVYNYDGPGFDSKVLSEPGYQRICKKYRPLCRSPRWWVCCWATRRSILSSTASRPSSSSTIPTPGRSGKSISTTWIPWITAAALWITP